MNTDNRNRTRLIFIYLSLSVVLLAASPPVIEFIDRAPAAKLNVITYNGGAEKNHILESTGTGVLLLDYDGDSDQDIYFVNSFSIPRKGQTQPHPNVLYRNDGKGNFDDVTSASGTGAAVYGQGGCMGDIDNDGLPDMYITNFGPNILYRNNGNGTFKDISTKAGVADHRWSIGCTFFDADNDGDQDLYVANYIEATWNEVHAARRTRLWRGKVEVLDGPKGLPGSPDTFYLNNGNGTFTEATEKAGLKPGTGHYSMGVVSFDYDNDGDIDLYVANDSAPNCLYRNRGNGTFEEIGTVTGAAYNADGQEQGSMGIDFGDYNNDGWFDIAVTNFAHDYYTLYRNLGGKFFQDESYAAGIAVPTFVPLGWGTIFFDVDHDTDLDLFFANGHIYPQVEKDPSLHETYKQKSQLFLNENEKFREISAQSGSGFQVSRPARGAAAGDLDNDGDLDLVITNQDGKPNLLENRSKSGNHWITLQLIDTKRSPLAIGARVALSTGKVTQIRQIASGGSYASQNDIRMNFGTGSATRVDRIQIRWPDGTMETHTAIPTDQILIVKRKN
jgi:hypothetical protein